MSACECKTTDPAPIPTALPRDAQKAYEQQSKLAYTIFRKAVEQFNDQTKEPGERLDDADMAPLDVAMRALEHMTRLTGLIHRV